MGLCDDLTGRGGRLRKEVTYNVIMAALQKHTTF